MRHLGLMRSALPVMETMSLLNLLDIWHTFACAVSCPLQTHTYLSRDQPYGPADGLYPPVVDPSAERLREEKPSCPKEKREVSLGDACTR